VRKEADFKKKKGNEPRKVMEGRAADTGMRGEGWGEVE
jgi:hypothetical protein